MNSFEKFKQASLATLLKEYAGSDYYPLHMPGHKRRVYGGLPEEVVGMDITEIDGFDNLHQAEGILKDMQAHAAGMYGADETFYLVNGSTCGILSAVSAAIPEGGHILMSRNCHKSVYHACYLRKLKISYLYPQVMESYDICEPITCEQVEHALEQERDIGAVLLVSPTYEGRIADIEGIARVVHERGIPLIVDEAHGAHLGFWEGFAENSCRQGADLVIHSVHKTLPAMTQTALLHVNGSLIDRDQLKRFLHIYQSSSPSYVLMASIDNALRQVEARRGELFGNFIHNWSKMCRKLSTMCHLSILQPGKKQDIGKLLVSVKKTGLSGQQLYDMLLQEYHLQLEMAAASYVLAMFTVGDSEEGYERLTQALLEIDGRLNRETSRMEVGDRVAPVFPEIGATLLQASGFPFYRAWDMEREDCQLSLCQGRLAGEFINLYPPGIPMVVPGEPISKELIDQINDCMQKGLSVQGVRQMDGEIYLSVLCSQDVCGRLK